MLANQPPITTYRIVVLTPFHSIDGDLQLRDMRLSDFLNDKRESLLVLRNVQIARLNQPGKVLHRHAMAVVPKAWAVLAFEPPQNIIPAAKRFYGYVKKQAYDVFLAMDGMEVKGLLHLTGDLDVQRILVNPTDSFLPITRAVVTLYATERYRIEEDAVMVNVNRVRYLAQAEPVPEGGGASEQARVALPPTPPPGLGEGS